MKSQGEFCKGDMVQICGQSSIGEIVKLTGKYAIVAFEAMEASVPLSWLQKAQPSAQTFTSRTIQRPLQSVLNLDPDAFFTFDTEIDLHGMRVPEALDIIERWVDRGSLLGHKYLKIIHGKGTGALSHAVRTYLQSHIQVERVVDKHPYPGGQGITWVELS